eukprot:354470-Chlamydomonas_euryale.AAC.46
MKSLVDACIRRRGENCRQVFESLLQKHAQSATKCMTKPSDFIYLINGFNLLLPCFDAGVPLAQQSKPCPVAGAPSGLAGLRLGTRQPLAALVQLQTRWRCCHHGWLEVTSPTANPSTGGASHACRSKPCTCRILQHASGSGQVLGHTQTPEGRTSPAAKAQLRMAYGAYHWEMVHKIKGKGAYYGSLDENHVPWVAAIHPDLLSDPTLKEAQFVEILESLVQVGILCMYVYFARVQSSVISLVFCAYSNAAPHARWLALLLEWLLVLGMMPRLMHGCWRMVQCHAHAWLCQPLKGCVCHAGGAIHE